MQKKSKLHPKRLLRMQWIDDAIRNSGDDGKTLEELLEWVNSKSQKEWSSSDFNKLEISSRSLQHDIQLLREGALDGHMRTYHFHKSERVYKSGIKKSVWTDSDTSDEQRATLPFLFAILEPFRGISAVEMVLHDIITHHKLELKDYQSDWTAVRHQLPNKKIQNRLNKMISTIMLHIKQGWGLEFEYSYVKYGPNREKMASTRKVFPIQLRMWGGRYFLVSVPADNINLVKTYALDGIKDGYINSAFGTDSQPVEFNHSKLSKQHQIKTYFDHSIGVFRDSLNEVQPIEIKQWFISHAASAVLAVPLHHSQEVLQTRGNAALLKFFVYHNMEWFSAISKFGDLTWNNNEGTQPEQHPDFIDFAND